MNAMSEQSSRPAAVSLAQMLYPDADWLATPTAASVAYREYIEELDTPPARPSQGRVLSRLVRGLTEWVGAIRERRAVLDQLARMSDRDLADIGLNRAQIHQVFDPAFARARNTPHQVAIDLDERMLADLGPSRTCPGRWLAAEIAAGEQSPNHACPDHGQSSPRHRRDTMRTTLLAAVAALSLAAANANAESSGTASPSNGGSFSIRALVAQANAQQTASSSSGYTNQLTSARSHPAGMGDRRRASSPGARQRLPRDYNWPAGIGCGLLCRAGIAAPPAQE